MFQSFPQIILKHKNIYLKHKYTCRLNIINLQAHKFYNHVFNFELENQLNEALTEFSSAQLFIKLLQEEWNTNLVLRSGHNHMYEMPCTTQRSRKSTTNIECMPANQKQMDPNKLKSLCETKEICNMWEYANQQMYQNFELFWAIIRFQWHS
jgi:hypothetical protein